MVNGWKECLITDVLKQDGIKIGPFGSQLKKEMLLNDGFLKVYGQENVYENDFNIGDRYLTREHFEKLKSCEILPGDFLMSTMGTIGKCAIVPPNIMPGIMDSHLIRLRFDESMINPEYVLQLFSDQYSFLQNQIQKLAVGGIMDGLSVGIVSNIRIVFPEDLEEQNCIVSTLKDADKLIHESQLLMEKYQAMKQGCLQHMFPRKGQTEPDVRLPGFTGAWEQRKLSDVANVYDGVHQTPDYQESGIMFLSVENISTLTSNKFISEEAFERDYKNYPEKGDILMTRIGDVGTPNVVETDEKVAFYVSLALLKPKDIDSYFLCNAIRSPEFQKGLRDRTLLTAIPQKINKDEIGKVEFLVPKNPDEQREIGAYFKNLDNLITLHQRKCEKYKMIKQGMMEDLLTGKVRLK